MSKLHHTIYLTIISALAVVVVKYLPWSPTEEQSQVASHRIAVFPMRSLGPDTADVAVELTSEIVQSLQNAPDTEVVQEFELPPGMRNVEEHHLWPKDQMISLIFEGTVMRIGENVRITVQLVDGSNDLHLWADTYEANYDDVAEVSEIVKNQVLAQAAR